MTDPRTEEEANDRLRLASLAAASPGTRARAMAILDVITDLDRDSRQTAMHWLTAIHEHDDTPAPVRDLVRVLGDWVFWVDVQDTGDST